MSIHFNCPSCRRVIGADVAPGTDVQCPLCGQVVTVPRTAGVAAMPGAMPYSGAAARPSSSLAVGALVCGILGLVACPLVGVVGLVLGIVALVKIRDEPERRTGKGLAIGGIITGALSIVVVPVVAMVIAMGMPRFMKMGERTVCTVNMTVIGQALHEYAQNEPNGAFPEAGADWQARLLARGFVTRDQLRCVLFTQPTAKRPYVYVPGYGMDSEPTQIIVYEPISYHGGGGNILYVDGSVQFVESPQYEREIAAIKLPDGTAWQAAQEQAGQSEQETEEEEE